MVGLQFIQKILKGLEKYLIARNNFHLLGDNYNLILFVPSDKVLSDTKYTLLISAIQLNNLNHKDVIAELLSYFKEILNFEEYKTISRLNILHSEDPFVKNLSFVFPMRERVIEIHEITIGGVKLDFAYLVKSLVLDKLVANRAVVMDLINGQRMNAGIIRIEDNFDVVYNTGKGLREIWKPNMTNEEKIKAEELKLKSEEFLIQHQYIMKTPLEEIDRIW